MISFQIPQEWTDAQGKRPLVMLTTSYPSFPGDIPGCFVKTLALFLRKEGHRVVVLTPAGQGAPPGDRQEEGVRVIRAGFPGWQSGPFHTDGLPEQMEAARLKTLQSTAPALLSLFGSALRVLAAESPRTVVIGHWLFPGGAMAQVLCRWFGVTPWTICHSGAARMAASLPRPFSRWAIRAGLGQGPFWATCKGLVALMEAASGEKLQERAYISPMPVEEPLRSTTPAAAPPWKLLTLGRLVPIKGLDLLLEALENVQEIELHVCGDGPEKAQLEAMARKKSLPVVFHGTVRGGDKSALLSTCHGFVQPSRIGEKGRAEGVPVALLEALSYDLPVLATRTGGMAEALEGERLALLVEPRADALREGLERFKETMDLRWRLVFEDAIGYTVGESEEGS